MSHPSFRMTETTDPETGIITFAVGELFVAQFKSNGGMVYRTQVSSRDVKDGIQAGLKEKVLAEMRKALEIEGVIPSSEEIDEMRFAMIELKALKERMGLPL